MINQTKAVGITEGACASLLHQQGESRGHEQLLKANTFQRWVKRNQEETARLSNGTIGYVHLYRMNDAAYRNV